MTPQFAGVIAAAVTPRGRDGDIDFGASFELLDHLSRGGVSGVALFDTAGEYPAFGTEQRSRLVYLGVKRSRVPVLAGAGGATLEDCVSLAREARQAGAAAVLLPPPFFYEYEQDELREFYLQFAAQLGLGIPVYLRNAGPTTLLAIETARELIETGRFAGIADDDPRRWTGSGIPVLACDDAAFPETRRSGARAAILEGACAVPELASALDRGAALDSPKTIALEAAWHEFAAWLRRFPAPALVKAALAIRGLNTGPSAVPLGNTRQALLECFGEWFRGWFPAITRISAHA